MEPKAARNKTEEREEREVTSDSTNGLEVICGAGLKGDGDGSLISTPADGERSTNCNTLIITSCEGDAGAASKWCGYDSWKEGKCHEGGGDVELHRSGAADLLKSVY